MLNRHSILFKLNIIFIVTIVSVTIIFLAVNQFMHNKQFLDLEYTLMKLEEISDSEISLYSYELELIEKKDNIISKATSLNLDDFIKKPPISFLKKDSNNKHLTPFIFKKLSKVKLLVYKDDIYIHLIDKKKNILFKYNNTDHKQTLFFIRLGYFIFISMMLLLYYLIRKNLNNLKTLQNSLKDYENGIVDLTKIIDSKDEIAEVSKQFYKVASRLDKISKSRKLFLRNMMHELKTPLTKSKLYLGLIEESELRDSLELSLNKLEFLIDDMANIEKISSDNVEIEKKEYRLVDLIDNAMDILFMQRKGMCNGEVENVNIFVDFKLFSIVLKNLIDNGIKYSQDHIVNLDHADKKIYVRSRGKKLKYDFHDYLEPFYKGDLNEQNQRGFGLGLYIVNEIIIKHGFCLLYEYIDGENIFIIEYDC